MGHGSSWFVRTMGGLWDLWLVSEVRGSLVGLNPSPVQSDANSRQLLSELSWIVGHPFDISGESENLLVWGEKKLTHFLSEAFAGRRTDQSIYLLNDHWSIRTLAPELWKIPAVGTLWGGSQKTMKYVHLRAHLYKHSIFLYKRDWVIFLSLYYYRMLSLMAKNQK